MQDSRKEPIRNPRSRNPPTRKVLMQDSSKAPAHEPTNSGTQEPTSSQGTNAGLKKRTNQEPTSSQGTNAELQQGTNSGTH